MINQDFSKKMTVVLDKDLKSWQLLNTVGHLSAFLGNKMDDRFQTGDFFTTKDEVGYPRNSQYPLIALSATQTELKKLVKTVRNSGLLYIAYIPEMVEYTDDDKLMEQVGQKLDIQIECLGVGIFGDNQKIKELTKQFSLWK